MSAHRENAMDMRALRYFVGVARAGSFSRAAAELNVAQPALSRQIQKLERELRVRLLVRSGRGVQITAAGSTLPERAEILLGLMRQVPDAVRGSAPGAAGHVTLGVPPAAGLLIAPAIIPRFRASLPQAS